MDRSPSPTNTEWNTFQVIANPDFVNINVPKPTFSKGNTLALAQAQPLPDKSPPNSPVPAAEDDIGDSISVVAAQQDLKQDLARKLETFHTLETIREADEDQHSHSGSVDEEIKQAAAFVQTAAFVQETQVPTFEEREEVDEVPKPRARQDAHQDPPEDEDASYRHKVREMSEAEVMSEKEGLLSELSLMEKQGLIKLYRDLTLQDSLEEIQFQ